MAFKEINPETWKPEKEGDSIEGIYMRFQANVGENNSMLYSIETKSGVKTVWGSTILDERMALVKINSTIRITYKGLAKEGKKGHNRAKIFKVEIDKEEKNLD